ncbi:hypothetical protein [Streptomyces misionensis]
MNGFGTLVVWAHPDRDGAGEGEQPSHVGAALARAARGVPGIRVHDDFPPPFVVHGTRALTDADVAAEAASYRTLPASPALPTAA